MEQQELLRRVELLEGQVQVLQSKLEELEREKLTNSEGIEKYVSRDQKEASHQQVTPRQYIKLDFQQESSPSFEDALKPKKERQSIEQIVATILPKIFIVILVLGVLWGLKVASDYGYFNNTMKVLLGYIGSITLFAIAMWMDRRQKGSMQVGLMLFGGAFIVGILTTAAGAILYEVLGLYVALLITIIYIGYGVAISYVKGSESLTVLVVFTSFLLPYLLEYMSFNSLIIALYVVLLFAVVQMIILKHAQKYALYMGAFFSVLALAITASMATESSILFPFAIVLVAALFVSVELTLFGKMESKLARLHMGILFSLLLYITIAIQFTIPDQTSAYMSLMLLTVTYGGCGFAALKVGYRPLVDVLLSGALIALLTMIFYFDTRFSVGLLLAFITIAVGLILANRLRAPFMQAIYSVLFSLISLIIIGFGNIEPFWSVEHLTYVLVAVVLALLYFQLRKPLQDPTQFELWRQRLQMIEWIPIALYIVVIAYSIRFQNHYLAIYEMPYLALLLIAVMFALTLFILPVQKHIPLFVVTVFSFGMVYIVLLTNEYISGEEVLIGLLLRLFYILIVTYALYNFMSGGIVKAKLMKAQTDFTWMAAIVLLLVGILSFTSFMELNNVVSQYFEVIANTVIIFAGATVSLLVGRVRNLEKIRLFGLALLFIGIVKLIFFDLSALDLLVRSVLFIVIGGLGLLLTNKLFTKN